MSTSTRHKPGPHLNKEEAEQEHQISERTAPPGEVVYGAIYREGEHELERNNWALGWSGLAAGLSMGFSFVTEALLRSYLPDAHWVPIISKLGYAVGFMVVILGRQQLFTKNTLTVILPLFNRRDETGVLNVARLWIVVLLANFCGAFFFAWALTSPTMFSPDMRAEFSTIGQQAVQGSFWSMFLRAIIAGWLIALMIWLLPFAESARIWVIAVLAYLVGLGHFPHIIAGAIPAFYYTVTGGISLGEFLKGFILPVLLGNVVGGVALVAAGVHAEFLSDFHHKHSQT